MQFNIHRHVEGMHAPFSPSQSSWLRYTDDQAAEVYINKRASEMGTILHAWAKSTIDLGIKQPRTNKTLNAYVNDAIGFKMSTEVVLFYSERFYGTADAISFKNMFLRIHDLKTGKRPAKMEQLLIYAALFCLEYKINPIDLKGCELRIYQNDNIEYCNPEPEEIQEVMDTIVHLDNVILKIDKEV